MNTLEVKGGANMWTLGYLNGVVYLFAEGALKTNWIICTNKGNLSFWGFKEMTNERKKMEYLQEISHITVDLVNSFIGSCKSSNQNGYNPLLAKDSFEDKIYIDKDGCFYKTFRFSSPNDIGGGRCWVQCTEEGTIISNNRFVNPDETLKVRECSKK